MIDGGEPEHVATLDEGLVLQRDLGEHHALLDIVGKLAGVETVLQRAMARSIQSAHGNPLW